MDQLSQLAGKEARLRDLACKRREMTLPGYKNLADYHEGKYDCGYVSPYTKVAANADSEVMIMLQDWASDDFLSGPFCPDTAEHGRARHRATNMKLDRLILQYFYRPICETYATNLFPFIKSDRMNAPIPGKDLVNAAIQFGIPQIRVVAPRLVIALGRDCFNGIRRAEGLRSSSTIAAAIEDPLTIDGSRVWCQAHTSPQGQNMRNRGRIDRVSDDWARMAAWFRSS